MDKQQIIKLYIEDLKAHVTQTPARDNRIAMLEDLLEEKREEEYMKGLCNICGTEPNIHCTICKPETA